MKIKPITITKHTIPAGINIPYEVYDVLVGEYYLGCITSDTKKEKWNGFISSPAGDGTINEDSVFEELDTLEEAKQVMIVAVEEYLGECEKFFE